MIIESSGLYMTIKRQYIYILAAFIIIAISITTGHIELDHRQNVLLNQETNNVEQYDDYKEIDIVYPLEIRNYQNDNKVIEYTYKIKIKDISGAYKYKYKDKESYMVFTANGEAQFILESNESIIIYDLPENAEYEIEQTTNVSNTYTTKIDKEYKIKTTGNVTANKQVAFDNETIKEETKPEHQEENPYTKDSYYFIVIIATFALIIGFIGKNYKFKRFD